MPQSIYEKRHEEFMNAIITLIASVVAECKNDAERVITLELFVEDIEEIVDSMIEDM